jgi:hypothetical protein
MTTRYLSLAAISIATLSLFACGSDSTMPPVTGNPNASVTAEAAMVSSDAMNSDVQLMMPTATTGNLESSDDDHGDPSFGCQLELLRFRCPPRVSGGLTINSAITFFDAGGVQQAAFDSLLTASMHIDVDVSGTANRDSWQSDVARHRHFVVTGLAGTETSRTWNGIGSDTLSRTRVRDTVTRVFTVTINTALTDVVVPVRGGRHPTSGTATQVVTMTETSGDQPGQTFTFTATYTFDGTVRIPFLFGGRHFHLDLDADQASEDH